MTKERSQQQYEIGMVGLGVMGRNFVLNMADHGFSVAGYDKDPTKVKALGQEVGETRCSRRHGHSRNSSRCFVRLVRS